MGEANCICCGQPTHGGKCVNVDCERAADQHAVGAGRATAKATSGAGAVSGAPRAWSSSGRVD